MPLCYERLPNFCTLYGHIGHLFRECSISKLIEGDATPEEYGPWLRATSPVCNVVNSDRKRGVAAEIAEKVTAKTVGLSHGQRQKEPINSLPDGSTSPAAMAMHSQKAILTSSDEARERREEAVVEATGEGRASASTSSHLHCHNESVVRSNGSNALANVMTAHSQVVSNSSTPAKDSNGQERLEHVGSPPKSQEEAIFKQKTKGTHGKHSPPARKRASEESEVLNVEAGNGVFGPKPVEGIFLSSFRQEEGVGKGLVSSTSPPGHHASSRNESRWKQRAREKMVADVGAPGMALTGKKMASILGVQLVGCHERYLGLPSFTFRKKQSLFSNIKERVWTLIGGWRRRLFSAADKKVMMKAVLQAILT
ncbi:hypothetical protein ACOSQ3_023267 [Xanthoceras sorbifolium]